MPQHRVYVQVCTDFESRCVSLYVFDADGNKLRENEQCGVELLEMSGTVLLVLEKRMTRNRLCLTLVAVEPKTELKGAVLKIMDSGHPLP
uniref:Uncharacterized protein n=1 Tax=Ignisphaera aggregans TaxID=334771 RepID=A0A7C2VE35_9CREN